MEYKLNKGVGQDVEFCGLKAQYLYLFAGGLLAVFLVFVILYMAGVNRLFCIALCVISASGINPGRVPPEQEIRPPRADEAGGGRLPSLLHHQQKTYHLTF